MANKITMPQLGESVTEGTISRWLVHPGDEVKKYDPIAEVTTDKVNAEVPSSYSGVIQELVAEENQTVQVGDLIAYITSQDNKANGSNDAPMQEAEKKDGSSGSSVVTSGNTSMKKRYSPAVLTLAQKHNLDLQQIEGTGRGGRITRKDVEHHLHEKSVADTASQVEETKEPASSGSDKKVPVSSVRKAIADNLVKSKQEIPHAWTMVEVDVTEIVRYRERMKSSFLDQEGFPLTYMPFFMQVVTEGLRKHPALNSTWRGDHILERRDINLSMAVATEEALYVPVIQKADELNIKGLARSLHTLAQKTRAGKLTKQDITGGTFTLNNTGSFGSIQSAPIINPPQAAILSVEAIVKRPVVKEDDMIAIRHMVNLCLSLDHRIVDGLVSGRFLSFVKERLENFDPKNEGL